MPDLFHHNVKLLPMADTYFKCNHLLYCVLSHRQSLLFSATLPKKLVEFAQAGKDYALICAKREGGQYIYI